MKEASRKFLEPLSFVLLGYVLLSYLIALFHLIIGPKTNLAFTGGAEQHTSFPITERFASEASSFLSLLLLGVIVVAVLLCTHVGSPTPHARPVAFVGLGVLGFGAVLGLISAIGGLADKSSNYYGGGRAKAEQFILDLVIVALFVLAALLSGGG